MFSRSRGLKVFRLTTSTVPANNFANQRLQARILEQADGLSRIKLFRPDVDIALGARFANHSEQTKYGGIRRA